VQREIRAAPYRDRVVHHALCAELEPVIEGHLIHDTYACRVGKGTHRALDRLQRFLRGGGWVAKVDVSKYFFSIDHGLLQALLRRLTADPRLEELVAQLLGTYDAGPALLGPWCDHGEEQDRRLLGGPP
jgi:RNA-directed DNA polymerase